jgi:hypothetical protein
MGSTSIGTRAIRPRAMVLVMFVAVCLGPPVETAYGDVNAGQWFGHKYGNPVLSPGDGTAGIDDTGTAWSYFMTNGPNDYRMYYTGISGDDYDICLATSTDRVHWTRITNGIGGSHKVIDDGSAWAGPVWKEDATYHMIYKKNSGGYQWYHVTSADGISWGPSDMYTGTLGTEISSLMKVGDTYHAWGSTGTASQVYHFTSTDLDKWTVQNGGNAVLEVPGSNVICPDVFYNVDESKYYAAGTITPCEADSPERYYGTFHMWKADDPDFQINKEDVGDLLVYNADTLPLMEDWEDGGNCDGQHFLWSDVRKQIRNSDPLFFYYSAEDTLDSVYNFSVGMVTFPTVAEALSVPEPPSLTLGAVGALFGAALALLRKRQETRERLIVND